MIMNVLHCNDFALGSILTVGSDITNKLQDSHSHELCINGDYINGDRGLNEITTILLYVSKVTETGMAGVAGP